MSTARTRPTREETKQRIFAAAAGVFAEYGVAGANIEQIAAAAGFTRGAFYSNFSSKDELAVAMLEDHLAHSDARNRGLLDRHPDAAGFVKALRADHVHPDDPLHQNPLLQVELMLYVARNPALRPDIGRQLRTMRRLVGDIAATTLGIDRTGADAEQLGVILVALEDGLRLHRLVDPDSTPEDAYFDALEALQRLTR